MESYLTIESIWEDESLFEVKVSASNGSFSGVACCYTNRSEIGKMADEFNGFPKFIGQEIVFTSGESDDLSYFTIGLQCVDGSGHIIARVKIAHINTYSNMRKEKYVSEFDIYVEPAAIDSFVNSIKSLSCAALGSVKAKLNGKI